MLLSLTGRPGVSKLFEHRGKMLLSLTGRPGVSKLFAKRARFGEVKMCGGRPFSLRFFEPLLMNAFNVNDKY